MPLRRKLDHRLGYATTVNTGKKHRKRLHGILKNCTFELAVDYTFINRKNCFHFDDDRVIIKLSVWCFCDFHQHLAGFIVIVSSYSLAKLILV